MKAEDKKRFIDELISDVRETVQSKVVAMPEEWDGVEIRQYLADKFAQAAYMKMDRKRKQAYRNTVLVENL